MFQRIASLVVALPLLVTPALAADEFKLADEPSDPKVLALFGSQKAKAAFNVEGQLVQTELNFNGRQGTFTRAGSRLPDRLLDVTYLTLDHAAALAAKGASAFEVAENLFYGECEYLIAAVWQISRTDNQGRVIWCANAYEAGQSFLGVYWASEKGLDWSDPIFTGTWDGTWR